MEYITGILQICELQCSLINKITDKELLDMHIVSVTQTQNMLSRSLSVNKSINDITSILEFSVIQNNIIKLINPKYTQLYKLAKQNFSLMISLISDDNPIIIHDEPIISPKHYFIYTEGTTLNIVQDENRSVINHNGCISSVSICAKNKIMVTNYINSTNRSKYISFWNLENNEHLYTFNTDCIYGLAITTDFIMSFNMKKNHILILNYLTQKDYYITIPNSLPLDSRIIISPNNKYAAILTHEKNGMRDILIYTIDITKKIISDSIKYKKPENAQNILCDVGLCVMDLVFIEDRLYYAYTSGYPNRFIIVEEINTEINNTNIRHCYKIPQQMNIITNIKLIPNSNLIAFISNKISLCIYNYESVESIFSININEIYKYEIYGDYICILDHKYMAKIYNYKTNTLEREINNNINSIFQNINICYYMN